MHMYSGRIETRKFRKLKIIYLYNFENAISNDTAKLLLVLLLSALTLQQIFHRTTDGLTQIAFKCCGHYSMGHFLTSASKSFCYLQILLRLVVLYTQTSYLDILCYC